ARRQKAALHDAGVVAFVADDIFPLTDEGAYDSEVHLKSRTVKKHGFFVYESSKGRFEFQMNVQSPVQESRTGATRAVFLHCCPRGFLDSRMVCQAQVTVGAKHQYLLALDNDLSVLSRGNGSEIRVQSCRAHLRGIYKTLDFVQEW